MESLQMKLPTYAINLVSTKKISSQGNQLFVNAYRPLESFNDTGLSHDLVRMKYMQHEQKRLMKLNQLCKYMFQSQNEQNNKRGK